MTIAKDARMRILPLLSLLLTVTASAVDTGKQLIDSTAFVIEEGFVDPERGREIARALRAKNVDSKHGLEHSTSRTGYRASGPEHGASRA
jgi:hypothetical protein